MKKKKWWIIGLVILLIIAAGVALFKPFISGLLFKATGFQTFGAGDATDGSSGSVIIGNSSGNATDAPPNGAAGAQRQTIRPAKDMVQINATGNIALLEKETVVSKIEALITAVHVKTGDRVSKDELLAELDIKDLKRRVEDTRFDLSTAQSALKKLTDPPDAVDLAAAEAELTVAQQDLEKTNAGATDIELYVAETNVFAAWVNYNNLKAGKTEDELAQAQNNLKQAERSLQRAQEAYDEISWRAGFYDEQALALESATDAYENAKAGYNQEVKPASEKDLRQAYGAALEAQQALGDLRHKPTAKTLAEAELRVSQAQKALDKLKNGPKEDELTQAQMNVKKTQLALEDAEARLEYARLLAPFDGTAVEVKAKTGKTAEVNGAMITIANLKAFKLVVGVVEANINRIEVGQAVQVTLDALPGETFAGEVSYISPISSLGDVVGSSGGGVTSYDVTIGLTESDLSDILAGMTAVVTFVDDTLADKWLVPTVALQKEGDATTVLVFRNGEAIVVAVETGIQQGEWTVVAAPELQAGDEVEAELKSFLDENMFDDEMYIGP